MTSTAIVAVMLALGGTPTPPTPAAVQAERDAVLSARTATASGVWDAGPAGRMAATGDAHSCSITVGGEIWCWGANSSGQLGIGAGGATDRPVRVTGQPVFRAADPAAPEGAIRADDIDAGRAHTCAVVVDSYDLAANGGTLYCWGANEAGQLGDGSRSTRNRPVPVLDDVARVAAGRAHTCVISGDATVSCWGGNDAGQLGLGTVGGHRDTPQPVPGLSDIVSLAAGDADTCAVDGNGRAWCWGADDHGQIGDGSGPGAPVPTPTRVDTSGGAGPLSEISVGRSHVCALGGEPGLRVWCWGSDSAGQLGNGGADSDTATPTPVSSSVLVAGLNAGGDSTCATNYAADFLITGDYTPGAYCWGDNSSGQLGVGDLADRTEPARVARGQLQPSPSSVAFSGLPVPLLVNLTVGRTHTCAADVDGVVYCWGAGADGQLGNRSTGDTVAPARTRLGPDPATAVRVTAGDATLSIRWTPPADSGAAPVWRYSVTATTRDGDATSTDVTGPGTIAHIGGLDNGARYSVVVVTYTRAGYSISAGRTATPHAAPTGGGGGGADLPATGPATPAGLGLTLLMLGVVAVRAGRRPAQRV